MAKNVKTFDKVKRKRKGVHSKNASSVQGQAKKSGQSGNKKRSKKYKGQGR